MKNTTRIYLINILTTILALVLAAFMVAIFAAYAFAEPVNLKIVSPNQDTFIWDHIIETEIDISLGVTIKYEIFLAPGGIPEGQDRNDPGLYLSQGLTSANIFTVTFPAKNKYLGGVRVIKYISGEDLPLISEISWSDDPEVASEPWIWVFYEAPQKPVGLKLYDPNIVDNPPVDD